MKKQSVSFLLKNCSRRGLKHNRSALIIIDAEDEKRVNEFTWFLKYDRDNELNFVYTTVWSSAGRVRTIKLGRLIYGEDRIPPAHDVDYKDGNPANNTKANLTLCRTYNGQKIYFSRRD